MVIAKKSLVGLICMLLVCLAFTGQRASADTVNVEIETFAFNPSILTVATGTTVRWINLDPTNHTSTSTTNVWDSGNLTQNDTFSFTFLTAGSFPYFCKIHPFMTGTINVTTVTDVGDDGNSILPDKFWLGANYPNPFNPSTTIEYNLAEQAHVKLTVFNVVGQRVKFLVDAEQSVGKHSASWDGTDERGIDVPSGIYFYRFDANDYSETRKMLLMK